MRRVDVERKRASRWPWALGIILLVGAVWGITVLLRSPPDAEPADVGTTAADTLPPAAIPAPAVREPVAAAGRDGLPPLDADHVGEPVRLRGVVVATGTDAFWMLASGRVLQVTSAEPVRRGDTLTVEGVLRTGDQERTDRITDEVLSRHPDFDQWSVIRPVRIDAESVSGGGTREG